jgi:hypothetical protein
MRKSGTVTGGGEDQARVRAAARNNAELCDVVSRVHGAAGVFAADAWTSARRTPPLYPDAVTLLPEVDAASLLARIDRSPGASVKDSFATLDLAPDGFRILFEAEWIFRLGNAPVADAPAWSAVADADALAEWERAWAGDDPPLDLFPSSLLTEPDVVFLSGGDAGAILNRSENVVGISNLFARTGDLANAWTGCLGEVSARFPGVPMVGYEPNASLDPAYRVGFRSIGRLRIWIDDR